MSRTEVFLRPFSIVCLFDMARRLLTISCHPIGMLETKILPATVRLGGISFLVPWMPDRPVFQRALRWAAFPDAGLRAEWAARFTCRPEERGRTWHRVLEIAVISLRGKEGRVWMRFGQRPSETEGFCSTGLDFCTGSAQLYPSHRIYRAVTLWTDSAV